MNILDTRPCRLALSSSFTIVVALLLLCLAACQTRREPQETLQSTPTRATHSSVSEEYSPNNFGRAWWENAKSAERLGFLAGLDDCLTYETKTGVKFTDSWASYERKINKYYQSRGANKPTAVQTVFFTFAIQRTFKPNELSDRYGDEWWRGESELSRTGFLEGYLSCTESNKDEKSNWSRPLGYYQQKIDDLYNVDDRHGEAAPEYSGTIASALQEMKDS